MAANVATARPLARADQAVLRVRILSALVLAPPAIAAAWFGSPWLQVIVAVAAACMGWEWARLAGGGSRLVGGTMAASLLVPIAFMVLGWERSALLLALLGSVAVWLEDGPARLWAALGTLSIALPCLGLLWLAQVAGRDAVLWLFVTVWATDCGAYAAGRILGGPRLAPAASPNKTWAGFIGGLAAAALVGAITAPITGAPTLILMAVGIGLSCAAQLGDLVESLAKRRFGVKDSSGLIPGHGGFLDRLDGMLAAAAAQSLLTLMAGASPLAWRI
jgi:phosphatidate cytidylyltransferase